jgi:hypothetical protein
MDAFDHFQWYTILRIYESGARKAAQSALDTLPSMYKISGMTIDPSYRLVRFAALPYLQLTVILNHQTNDLRFESFGRAQRVIDQFNLTISSFQAQMVVERSDFGVNQDIIYKLEFSDDAVKSFSRYRRIPLMVLLPQRMIELRPDLPEFTYPGMTTHPTRSHWVSGKPNENTLVKRARR